jgi:cytidylate kinase
LPDRAAETMQHLCRHWEEKRAASRSHLIPPAPHALTIALSREAGAQGTAVGQEVATRLGWRLYDHELLERIAQDMGVHTSLVESVDEKRVSWLLETFEALMSTPYASKGGYVRRLVKTVLALGIHGDCIIVGRGAAFILPAVSTLRVRLIAPRKTHSAATSQQPGSLDVEAIRQLEAIDRERNTFVQDHFFKDPADPRHYDLVVNFARFGVKGCAKLIVDALDGLQATRLHGSQETATSMQDLEPIRKRGLSP